MQHNDQGKDLFNLWCFMVSLVDLIFTNGNFLDKFKRL